MGRSEKSRRISERNENSLKNPARIEGLGCFSLPLTARSPREHSGPSMLGISMLSMNMVKCSYMYVYIQVLWPYLALICKICFPLCKSNKQVGNNCYSLEEKERLFNKVAWKTRGWVRKDITRTHEDALLRQHNASKREIRDPAVERERFFKGRGHDRIQ